MDDHARGRVEELHPLGGDEAHPGSLVTHGRWAFRFYTIAFASFISCTAPEWPAPLCAASKPYAIQLGTW